MNRNKGLFAAFFLSFGLIIFTCQAKAEVSAAADAKQTQSTQQQQNVFGGSPNQSITFGGSNPGPGQTIPRTIMPYSPVTQLTHPGYWIPVAKDGLFEEMHAIFAQRKVWTLHDALAFVNCVERSPGEVKNLFDIRVVALSSAGSPQRTMTYIDNYEANDIEEFNCCFRLVGTSAVFGTRGRHLTKIKNPVDSNEVSGRALQGAFEKLDGSFFILGSEGAPMQVNADSLQQNAGVALGHVSGPGPGNMGAFLGYTRNWSDAVTWPLRVPFLRLNTYESTGRKYVPRRIREAKLKLEREKAAKRAAYLKAIAEGDDEIQPAAQLEAPRKKPDPRIIRNGGTVR